MDPWELYSSVKNNLTMASSDTGQQTRCKEIRKLICKIKQASLQTLAVRHAQEKEMRMGSKRWGCDRGRGKSGG